MFYLGEKSVNHQTESQMWCQWVIFENLPMFLGEKKKKKKKDKECGGEAWVERIHSHTELSVTMPTYTFSHTCTHSPRASTQIQTMRGAERGDVNIPQGLHKELWEKEVTLCFSHILSSPLLSFPLLSSHHLQPPCVCRSWVHVFSSITSNNFPLGSMKLHFISSNINSLWCCGIWKKGHSIGSADTQQVRLNIKYGTNYGTIICFIYLFIISGHILWWKAP